MSSSPCPTADIKEVKKYNDTMYNAVQGNAIVSKSENREGCPVPLWARNSQALSDKYCKKICDKAGTSSCKAVSVTESKDHGFVCTLSSRTSTDPDSRSYTFVRK